MEDKEVTILVKYHDDIEHITEIKGGDWLDLRAAEDVTLEFMKEGTVIKKGDRICQFRIVKNQPDIHLIEVKHLGNEDRGGFGSTGTK